MTRCNDACRRSEPPTVGPTSTDNDSTLSEANDSRRARAALGDTVTDARSGDVQTHATWAESAWFGLRGNGASTDQREAGASATIDAEAAPSVNASSGALGLLLQALRDPELSLTEFESAGAFQDPLQSTYDQMMTRSPDAILDLVRDEATTRCALQDTMRDAGHPDGEVAPAADEVSSRLRAMATTRIASEIQADARGAVRDARTELAGRIDETGDATDWVRAVVRENSESDARCILHGAGASRAGIAAVVSAAARGDEANPAFDAVGRAVGASTRHTLDELSRFERSLRRPPNELDSLLYDENVAFSRDRVFARHDIDVDHGEDGLSRAVVRAAESARRRDEREADAEAAIVALGIPALTVLSGGVGGVGLLGVAASESLPAGAGIVATAGTGVASVAPELIRADDQLATAAGAAHAGTTSQSGVDGASAGAAQARHTAAWSVAAGTIVEGAASRAGVGPWLTTSLATLAAESHGLGARLSR